MRPVYDELEAAVVDVDGTLVDSSYHHVLAWSRGFLQAGIPVELWRLHEHMGMGGDRLVAAVAGEEVERSAGDEIRSSWERWYDELVHEVRAFDGATELLARLASRGLRVVLATSGKPSHTRRALEILGLDEDAYPIVSSSDAASTKPAPDLVETALAKVSAERGVMVGDTVWDVQAAGRLGLPAVCVLGGGMTDQVLRAAGAVSVHRSPRSLLDHLDNALGAAAGRV